MGKVRWYCPKRANQARVAKLLGISVAELVSGASAGGRGLDVRPEVPLVSSVEAGNYTVIENFRPRQQFETRAGQRADQASHLCTACAREQHGQRGRHSIPEGSILIVEPEMVPSRAIR